MNPVITVPLNVLPPPHKMRLHSDATEANLDAPKYDGSQDARQWLSEIEKLCQDGIPPAQMTEMALKCTAGEANLVLTAMFETKVAKEGAWLWPDFKECVIQIEGEHSQPSRPRVWVVLISCDRWLQAEYEGLVLYIPWRPGQLCPYHHRCSAERRGRRLPL